MLRALRAHGIRMMSDEEAHGVPRLLWHETKRENAHKEAYWRLMSPLPVTRTCMPPSTLPRAQSAAFSLTAYPAAAYIPTAKSFNYRSIISCFRTCLATSASVRSGGGVVCCA